jgi:signal transduction histidine kinase/AmiR/NasT family two-component response regulator
MGEEPSMTEAANHELALANELTRAAGEPPPFDLNRGEPAADGQADVPQGPSVPVPSCGPMELQLADLIDLAQMQQLLDSLCDALGVSAAILEPCGRVLVAARWKRICTEYHRGNDRTRSRCFHSDTVLARQLREGESVACYRCRNGLTDAASPIVIDGRHFGNVFVGQLLLEPADEDYFRRQAAEFGFDEHEYLQALRQVPVVPKEKLSAILTSLAGLARLVATVGLERQRGNAAGERLAQRANDLDRANRELERQRQAALGLAEDANRARIEAEHARATLNAANEELESQKLNLEAHRQEYLAANEQLQWALQAKSANVAKSQFLANVSHEIRTPMMAVLGYAELLATGLTDPEHREAVSTIRRNGDHLLAVINDILDVSKIEAGEIRVDKAACALPTLLADVAELVRIRAHAKGIGLKLEYAGPIPQTIVTDPTRLRQILVNLVGNAVKFTETGEVRMVASLADRGSPNPTFQCAVIDTGIGMSPGEIETLFQPFHQIDSSCTRKYGGTGLGLAISKRLAVVLGGDITVRSAAGEGSTFTVTLPTGPLAGTRLLERPEPRRPEAVPVEAQSASQVRLDCRVLLAEDGPDNQRFIATVLRKAGGEVTVVENGQEAMVAALATTSGPPAGSENSHAPFDVILMDMQMPVMDGYEATRRLRQAGYRGPIVALTAHAMSDDAQKCLDAGCDDYATKPIDRKRLISLVAAHAARQWPRASVTTPQLVPAGESPQ